MPKAMQTPPIVQIHTGVHLHRRKQVNIVTNDDGEPLWTGASIFKACRWCLDNEFFTVTMHHDDDHIRVMLAEPLD